MPTYEDFITDLHRMRDAVMQQLPALATLLSLTGKALAERKIRDQGFNASYSENLFPAFLFYGKAKSAAGRNYITSLEKKAETQNKATNKNKKNGEHQSEIEALTNWQGLRAAEGLQTGHVDLSFTNRMWAGMEPLQPYEENGKTYAPLGGTNQDVIDKMNWNYARYGDFIGQVLTTTELELLRETILDEIKKIIDQSGFQKFKS